MERLNWPAKLFRYTNTPQVRYGHLIGIRRGFGIADTSDSVAIIKVCYYIIELLDIILLSMALTSIKAYY